eukprot:TRINITY_DN32606_c0_g1_i1.p1 TRINITY_DN32606_c0_g1~~TRINITY_DN32606_c0_g1_i1.p1  ORF type:complete len:264 (+),score=25.15 TRINITY_DN32606_c0_g1_i1:76-867(+)
MLFGIMCILTLPKIAPWLDFVIGAGQDADISSTTQKRHNEASLSEGPFTKFSDTFYRENFGPSSGQGITESMRVLTTAEDMLTVLFLLFAGFLYKCRVTDRRPSAAGLSPDGPLAKAPHDFEISCFACHGDLSVWAWSLLAWSARMGDTYHAAGVANFWAPWAVYVTARIGAFLLGAIPCMLGGVPTFSMKILQSVVYAKWRQDLREHLGAPAPGSKLAFVKDATMYLFLPWCLIAQEAWEVDRATSTKVVGCTLQRTEYSLA